MPTVGGLHTAMPAGRGVGCDLVQIFTKSPQQWKARELTDEQVEQFRQAQAETGVPCIAAHDTYLINPASGDAELLEKSREALCEEMTRSARLAIPLVVIHLGSSAGSTEEDALERLCASVRRVLERAPDPGPRLLLETIAGQGSSLGHRFEQLRRIFDAAGWSPRLGICFDTCHVFAAGYDLRDEEAYARTMEEFDRAVGIERIALIHANDSKRELGSRVDRHEAIGRGHLGMQAFRLLLRDARLAHVPVVLETPKDGDMDPVNLAALRRAAGVPARRIRRAPAAPGSSAAAPAPTPGGAGSADA